MGIFDFELQKELTPGQKDIYIDMYSGKGNGVDFAVQDKKKISVNFDPKQRKGLMAVAAAAVLIIVYWVGGIMMTTQNFERRWARVEDDCLLYLDVDDGSIDYTFSSIYFDTTIAEFDYSVVGPGKVKISHKGYSTSSTYSVEIDDNIMTIRPALTSSSSSEIWIGR